MWPKRRKDNTNIAAEIPPPAGPTIKAMGYSDINECWRLDQRCFSDGEAYDKETFRYLLSHNNSVCYKVVTTSGEMIAFVVGMIEGDGNGHVVALGVKPEDRRRGHGRTLMWAIERGFYDRGVRTIRLEVRTSNEHAQKLYFDLGYKIIRRMQRYYTSGDDGYLMIKTLV
ncbi:MAG: ribosomal-protein-alanine N-acetyltransferase [Blastocatellia bacterium AA13]|nr:MAG: ribosomal-protein-alanine N-acetyltransferase [Blastocatellia bacterium AA13]